MAQHIMDFFEDKARKGEGQFAIAYAILEMARAQNDSAKAIDRLGFNNAGSGMGALEGLAVHLKEAAEDIAESIKNLAEAD